MSKPKVSKKVLEQEAKRQRVIVKDVLYKHLLENSKSIEEAKVLCQVAAMFIQEAFGAKMNAEQARLSACKLSELNLEELAKKDKKAFADFKPLFAMFQDETVATSSNLLKGMADAITSFQRKEDSERKLDTLKTDFL